MNEPPPSLSDPRPPPDEIDLQRTGDAVRARLFGGRAPTLRLGRFVIEGYAGDGAMGRVYVAYDPTLDRRVALKLMRGDARGDQQRTAEQGRRLVTEAKALAKLAHPHVVPVYEVGEIDGDEFVAMEFIDGLDLRDWLVDRPRHWRQIVDVFVQAARGVAAAHAVGLVHRDLKPANILVGRDGRARVVDFGLARVDPGPATPASEPDPGSPRTHAAGTPAYMAPELAAGEVSASPGTDLYALGVSLHEALHSGPTDRSSDRRAPVVPRWLDQVVAKARAPRPDDRYVSVDAFVAALQADPSRRWRRLLTLSVLTVAVAVAYVVGTSHAGEACDARTEIRAAWSDEDGAAIVDAFRETGLAFAPAASQRVVRRLAAYADRWVDASDQVCRSAATGVRSRREGIAATQCLAGRAARLAAQVEVFSAADERVVTDADALVDALAPIDDCLEAPGNDAPLEPDNEVAGTIGRELARARAQLLAGHHDVALALARAARDNAQGFQDERLIARAELVLGVGLSREGEYDRSSTMLLTAASRAESAGDDVLAAQILTQYMEVVGDHLRRPVEALAWEGQVVAKLRRTGRHGGLDEAQLARTSGKVRTRAGSFEHALQDFERALAIRRTIFGADDPAVASSLSDVANTHQELGRLPQARQAHEEALLILEAAFGVDHPRTINVSHNLGITAWFEGDYTEAAERFEASLVARERLFGPDHLDVAGAHNDLANTLGDLARFDDARAHYAEALRIRELRLDRDHPLIAATLNNLGLLDQELGRPDDALASLQRAVAIYDSRYGSQHQRTANARVGLGDVLRDLGRHEEALAEYVTALAVFEAELGAEHFAVARPLVAIAAIRELRGEWVGAEVSLRRALTVLEAAVPGHADVGVTAGNLGHVLLQRGELDEAEQQLTRARKLIEGAHGPGHPLLVRVASGLGALAMARGAVDPDTRAFIERAGATARAGTTPDDQRRELNAVWERVRELPRR